MNPLDWRGEIEGSLIEAQAAFATAEADLLAAQAEQAALRAAGAALHESLARLRRPLSSTLAVKLREADRAANGGDGRVAQAAGVVMCMQERLLDLHQALGELRQLAGEEVEP